MNNVLKSIFLFLSTSVLCLSAFADIDDKVQYGYAENNGVKLHYAECGEGPLVVMIHGFPDFWYSWRHQMEALSDSFHVVAFDLRGYNKSDKPKGQENYDISILVKDVASVIHHFGQEKAIVVGHNWGGFIAWNFAMQHPEMTEKLVVLNLPHPKGFLRELENNPEQQKNSQYARDFQKAGVHERLTPEYLADFIAKDEETKKKYTEAHQRSDIEAMLFYYKQNYPKEPYKDLDVPIVKIKSPVLLFHGLKDKALLHNGLNNTWEWLDNELTLVTVPNAGHWVHHDDSELVSMTMKDWLKR